jgi:hypothetical protein
MPLRGEPATGPILGMWLVFSSLFCVPQAKSSSDQAQQEFFELKVRPLLAKNCFSCHTDAKMGGLQLDTREHVLKGGNSGPVVVPGDPDRSLLIKAINHTDGRLEMPPPGKLTSEEISILETWVKDGAVWGAASDSSAAIAAHEDEITPEQRAFWSFQPVRKPLLPKVKDRSGSNRRSIASSAPGSKPRAPLQPRSSTTRPSSAAPASTPSACPPPRRKSTNLSGTIHPMHLQRLLIGCWHLRITANAGDGIGSISLAILTIN